MRLLYGEMMCCKQVGGWEEEWRSDDGGEEESAEESEEEGAGFVYEPLGGYGERNAAVSRMVRERTRRTVGRGRG